MGAIHLGRRAVAAAVVAAVVAALPATSAADVGFEGPSYAGTSTATGSKRAESLLWFNDGLWWAVMWDTVSRDFHIFRRDAATNTWQDTGTTVDTRANTASDVLWDGTRLYVASHRMLDDGLAAQTGYPSNLYRFSYDRSTKRYTRDSGFPVQINDMRTETLVIDKDSTGKLWATWQQDNRIYVNRTTGDDRRWGTPFQLPVSGGAKVSVDDISSIVSMGDRIGVMWSNQAIRRPAFFFAVHRDGQPDGTWEQSRTAIQGADAADDHINLKSVQADGAGRVYAAIKTEHDTPSAPLVMLLVRNPADGSWASYPIARVSDCPNRPIVLIDEQQRVLHTYATYPAPPDYACTSSGGAIYEKTSPMDAIAFPSGRGTPVMVDSDSPFIHNVSSTKQPVSSATGIALLAANNRTARYWHAFEPL